MRTLILFTLTTLALVPGVYNRYRAGKTIPFLQFAALCFCAFCLLVSIVTAVKAQVNMERDAQAVIEQRDELVDRIDVELEDDEWMALTKEINAFNDNILAVRRDSENPWVNWFVNSDIAAIKLIEIPARESDSLS